LDQQPVCPTNQVMSPSDAAAPKIYGHRISNPPGRFINNWAAQANRYQELSFWGHELVQIVQGKAKQN